MHIMLITRSLAVGGAERQLVNLALGLKQTDTDVSVLTFYDGGSLSEPLFEAGIPIYSLNKKGRWDLAAFFWRFPKCVHHFRPDVLYGVMDVPNILALLAKLRWRKIRAVWSLPASNIDPAEYGWGAVASNILERWLSKYPDIIFTNSLSGREHAEARNFPEDRIQVVPNGINTEQFVPSTELKARQREQWGIQSNAVVVGMVGRLDPVKDHRLFIDVARHLLDKGPEFRFVCVGDGDVTYRAELKQYAQGQGLTDKLLWVGEVTDMVAAYNALNVLVLTSRSEGLPNVLGEAMACGVPCVVTDVGDAGSIVAETGVVIEGRSPSVIVEGVLEVLNRKEVQGEEYAKQIRDRIVDHFGQEAYIHTTLAAIKEIV